MAIQSIDKFTFVVLERADIRGGPPTLEQPQTELVQRPGVPGSGILDLGRKGTPFKMRSAVDITQGQIDLVQKGYLELVAAKRVNIIWNNLDYGAIFATKYVVLDVETTAILRITAKAGGLTNAADTWYEALWTLLPVSTETE